MKIISLWQPWAALIAILAKMYETRGWDTQYRGPIAIHAAKRTKELKWTLRHPGFIKVLEPAGYRKPSDFPLGAIVAVANLTGMHSTNAFPFHLSDQERLFGDYSPDRWAWELTNIVKLDAPVEMNGHQGLWNLEGELAYELKELLYTVQAT